MENLSQVMKLKWSVLCRFGAQGLGTTWMGETIFLHSFISLELTVHRAPEKGIQGQV